MFSSFNSVDRKVMPLMVALSLSLNVHYLIHFDFRITEFTNRAIGISILNGIDPSLRQTVYLMSFFIFGVSFILQKSLFSILLRGLRDHFSKKEVDSFIQAGFEIGLIWLFTLIYNFASLFGTSQNELVQLTNYNFLTLPFIFAMEWLGLMALHSLFPKYIKPIYQSDLELWAFMFLPLILLYVFAILRTDGLSLSFFSTGRILVTFGITVLLMAVKSKYLDLRRVLYHSAWLFIIPILHIVASEIQYSYKASSLTSAFILKVLLVISFGMFGLTYIIGMIREKNFNLQKRLERFILPLLIAVFFISAYHVDVLKVGFLDLVGNGNKVTPVQQFLQFGSIPLVDYWGAQHFEIGVLFYSLIHGMNALEPIVWVQLKNLLILLIFYFVFKQQWGTRWTFLFLLFLPAVGYINIYYFGAFLPMLLVHRLLNHKTKGYYFIFTLLSLVTFVWMPSMGKISILASLVLMLFSLKNRQDLKQFILGSGAAYGLTVLVYVALVLLRGHDLGDQITLIKAFSAIDYNVGAYPTVIAGNTPAWATISVYGLFPLFYVGYLMYFLFKQDKNHHDMFMLFMVVASMVSSLRLLGRHSLYEGEVNFDFILIILMTMVLHYKPIQEEFRHSIFIGLNIFFFLFYGFESTLLTSKALNDQTIKTYAVDETRFSPDLESYPTNLIKLLTDVLEGDQTFYDNQNGNLLFELTGKKQAFLHHSAQMLYSEPPQEVYVKQFEPYYEKGLIPIIVFDGLWWGADTDGIPTEFSTFKLTEFIYAHYKPWISVDGYNLWVALNSSIPEQYDLTQIQNDSKIDTKQTFNLLKLPYVWANDDLKFKQELPHVLYETEVNQSVNALELMLDPIQFQKKSSYVYLTLNSNLDYEESIDINANENHVTMTVYPGINHYAIRMSTIYEWYLGDISILKFSGSDAITLEKLQILEGD